MRRMIISFLFEIFNKPYEKHANPLSIGELLFNKLK